VRDSAGRPIRFPFITKIENLVVRKHRFGRVSENDHARSRRKVATKNHAMPLTAIQLAVKSFAEVRPASLVTHRRSSDTTQHGLAEWIEQPPLDCLIGWALDLRR